MTIIDIPQGFHNPDVWAEEYRAEELAVYAGPTVSVDRQRRWRVQSGTVRNRTQRGA